MSNKSKSIILNIHYITIYKSYINYIMFLKYEVNFIFNLFNSKPYFIC